jgi:F0F1-type ATP synthase assembly protein I
MQLFAIISHLYPKEAENGLFRILYKEARMQKKEEDPKFKKIVDAADGLSLGISMVVAVLIGIAIGIGLKNLTGAVWTLWIGVAIGIGAAVNNVYIAYRKQKKSLDELIDDPRYRNYRTPKTEDEDEDDKY